MNEHTWQIREINRLYMRVSDGSECSSTSLLAPIRFYMVHTMVHLQSPVESCATGGLTSKSSGYHLK